MGNRLRRIALKGFRSIESMDLTLDRLNVLIGANGAGKSNLISFFRMLNAMMGSNLQEYIAVSGRAHSLLRFGSKVTPQIEATLEFETTDAVDTYDIRLSHAAGDTLIFTNESLTFHNEKRPQPRVVSFGAGHHETRIPDEANRGDAPARVIRHLLNNCRVYHFHDTSPTARLHNYCYLGNNRPLMHDAANLAAFLFRIAKDAPTAYGRIVSTIQLIAPFFEGFDLQPTPRHEVVLNWREKGSDQIFGPHQLSDGTLRAICLVTLLMQPDDDLPDLIIVDEPELGLHPYAIEVIASLFKKVSHHTQVLTSTQSSGFLDHFDPVDVIVADRGQNGSEFSRPNASELTQWLEDYSLGEAWQKNVFGGGPH